MRARHLLQGIGSKIVALSVVPMLVVVVGFSIGMDREQGAVLQAIGLASDQRDASVSLTRALLAIKDGASSIEAASGKLLDLYLAALLGQDASATKAIREQRGVMEAQVKRFTEGLMELDDPYLQYRYTTLDTFLDRESENHIRYRGKKRGAFLI